MTEEIKQTIKRIREMQDWRRGVGKYMDNTSNTMPVNPRVFGEDIDRLCDFIEQDGFDKTQRIQYNRILKNLDTSLSDLKKIIEGLFSEDEVEVQKNQKFYLHCLSVLSSMEASVQLLKNRMKKKG